MVIWITGLPGSGKSTISKLLYEKLYKKNIQTVLLDGDQLREAFDNQKYDESSRKRLSYTYSKLATLFSLQNQFVIVATVSMFDDVREFNRTNNEDYLEIYLKVDSSILHERNQKQLYSEALNGVRDNVHGINYEYEEPKQPNIIVNNDGSETPESIVYKIMKEIHL
jgi:adenylylsulfate kinase